MRMVNKDGNCLNYLWVSVLIFIIIVKLLLKNIEFLANSMYNFKSNFRDESFLKTSLYDKTRNLVDPARHTRWSQRLSHACLRPSSWNSETAKGSVYQNLVIRVTCVQLNIEMDNRRNSRANTYILYTLQ